VIRGPAQSIVPSHQANICNPDHLAWVGTAMLSSATSSSDPCWEQSVSAAGLRAIAKGRSPGLVHVDTREAARAALVELVASVKEARDGSILIAAAGGGSAAARSAFRSPAAPARQRAHHRRHAPDHSSDPAAGPVSDQASGAYAMRGRREDPAGYGFLFNPEPERAEAAPE
jgi:hypothetical protein